MRFEELLDELRTAGGIADNVRRDAGNLGFGIFPIDPRLPVRLHASENLLIPTEAVEVRDGKLRVRASSTVGSGERRLFEDTHEHFGWSAGGFEELWTTQAQWSRLPAPVVTLLESMGTLKDPAYRFAEPSDLSCLHQFIRSRDFTYKGKPCLAPLVDFANHSSSAAPFVIENGVGIGGTFDGEVFVRYNVRDSWDNALTYSFPDNAPVAYSIGITVELYGSQRLSIRRDVADADVDPSGIRFPKKRFDGTTIDLSFMLLGNTRQPDLPRGIFRKLMSGHVAPHQADEVFESIARFNQSKFLSALRILRRHDVPLAGTLEEAAINQLDALSASVGARPL